MSDVKMQYQSGVCNIGRAEKRARRQAGWFGIVITVVLWAVFVMLRIAAPWRLFLFVPAMLAASGFFQARMSFCVNFGMRGVENFGDKIGAITVIEDPSSRRRDKARSYQIMGYSAVVAVFVALAGLLSAFLR